MTRTRSPTPDLPRSKSRSPEPKTKPKSESRGRSMSRSKSPAGGRDRANGDGKKRTPSRSHSRGRDREMRDRSASEASERWGREEIDISGDDAAFILGKGGKTKMKIARVANASLDLTEKSNNSSGGLLGQAREERETNWFGAGWQRWCWWYAARRSRGLGRSTTCSSS